MTRQSLHHYSGLYHSLPLKEKVKAHLQLYLMAWQLRHDFGNFRMGAGTINELIGTAQKAIFQFLELNDSDDEYISDVSESLDNSSVLSVIDV